MTDLPEPRPLPPRSSGLPYPLEPPTAKDDLPPRPLAGASAAWGLRGAARVLDFLLFNIIFSFVAQALGTTSDKNGVVSGPTWPLLLFPIFFILYETIALNVGGQTLGKWVCQIKVVSYHDGSLPEVPQTAMRALIPGIFLLVSTLGVITGPAALGYLEFVAVLIYLASIADPLVRGAHDKGGGTIVLAAPRPKRQRFGAGPS